MENRRTGYLDCTRVLVIVSVISNQAFNRSFPGFATTYDAFLGCLPALSAFRAVVFIFSRIGVPFFLMISGSLLLNKRMETKEDILRFYRHNLGTLLITCEIWLFLNFWA